MFSIIKKYPKDSVAVATVVLVGILAVSGGGFADYANKSFWQHFWSVGQVVAIVSLIGGWIYLASKERAANKSSQ